MASSDKEETGGEARTRGKVGPIAGRAPTVSPAASREQPAPDGRVSDSEDSGSPGAMEDEAQATHRD